MKCTVYAAVSANAQLARKNGDIDFISKDEWKAYARFINGKVLVVGRVTYGLMVKGGDFAKISPKSVIVVSRRKKTNLTVPHHYWASSPSAALALGKKMKAKEIVIGGGSQMNTAFLRSGLAHELIMDVEPIIIGSGLPMPVAGKFDICLELKRIIRLNKNLVQLQYIVS